MTHAPRFYAAAVKAAVDAVAAQLNSGKLDIYSGAQPAVDGAVGTRIARMTFGATAFGASTNSGGTVTATANAITSDSSAVGGTAGYAALVKSDGTTVVATLSADVSANTPDLVLSSTSIAAGATVSCSSFTITQSQT